VTLCHNHDGWPNKVAGIGLEVVHHWVLLEVPRTATARADKQGLPARVTTTVATF
jgi:hypothetical protein